MQIKRILVPIDFSDGSRAAIERAVSLAQKFDATLEVLHVCPLLVHAIAPGAVPDDPSFEADLRKRLSERVDSVVEQLVQRGVRATGRFLTGHPAHEIANVTESDGCDLVVMATHGRTGLERLTLGSVAEHVLRRSNVPVLTVKPY